MTFLSSLRLRGGAKLILILILLAAPGLLGGCATFSSSSDLDRPLPDDFLPTAVALTLEASGVTYPSPGAVDTPEPTATLTRTPTLSPTVTLTPSRTPPPSATPGPPTETPPEPTITRPYLITATPTPSDTPWPDVEDAAIQIFRLGELSKLRSPQQISIFMRRGAVGPLRIELLGEDGRILMRQVYGYKASPHTWVNLSFKLEFEISAAAEVGRLVISTEDEFGRIKAINSVNLILLSAGESDINPPTAIKEAIIIQQPVEKSLIQGGTLLVSGITRPNTFFPLRVQLVTEDGRVVGQRLAGTDLPPDGGYGTFLAEVPYTVTSLTRARLMVFEDGERISPITHLSSVEVLLSP